MLSTLPFGLKHIAMLLMGSLLLACGFRNEESSRTAEQRSAAQTDEPAAVPVMPDNAALAAVPNSANTELDGSDTVVNPDQCTIGTFKLHLEGTELRAVSHDGKEISIHIPAPHACQFHRTGGSKGPPRTVKQEDASLVLVECFKRISDRDCDTVLKSLKITGESVRLSDKQQRVAGCPPLEWDSGMFTWFWHSRGH